jgi:hypothetical protein
MKNWLSGIDSKDGISQLGISAIAQVALAFNIKQGAVFDFFDGFDLVNICACLGPDTFRNIARAAAKRIIDHKNFADILLDLYVVARVFGHFLSVLGRYSMSVEVPDSSDDCNQGYS